MRKLAGLSCTLVLVYQTSEPVPADHRRRLRVQTDFRHRPTVRRHQLQASVRSMAIVMNNEDREHAFGVTRIEHEQPIEAVGTDGSNESFRDPVRLWGLDRRPNDANPRTLAPPKTT